MGHFLTFYPASPRPTPPPLETQKSEFEKSEKMNKIAGDIVLHMCIKNHNHMRYGSWDMEWDRQKFL